MKTNKLRKDFPVLQKKINNKPLIYFDNAATSLKPYSVIEAMNYYYEEASSNVHRGIHALAEDATEEYENARKIISGFINAKPRETIFTSGATESFNLIMYALCNSNYFKPKDEILITEAEHHSNIVPWQFLEKKTGVKLKFVRLGKNFEFDFDDFKNKISKKTKLVSITHASNTLGSIANLKQIGNLAKDSHAYFAVDASQSIPHTKIDVKKISCDFLVFSAHKMLGPTGAGICFGKEEILQELEPFKFGGDMISKVEWHNSEWNVLPYKFEAGTPNISGVLGFKAAVEYLKKISYEKINSIDSELLNYAIKKMEEISNLKIYGPKNSKKQVPTILFEIKGIDCNDLAIALDEADNIAIRSGMMCAEPLISSLNPKGLNRASFYFYNTKEEIDIFARDLEEIGKALGKNN